MVLRLYENLPEKNYHHQAVPKKLYLFIETIACVAEKNVWITADFKVDLAHTPEVSNLYIQCMEQCLNKPCTL